MKFNLEGGVWGGYFTEGTVEVNKKQYRVVFESQKIPNPHGINNGRITFLFIGIPNHDKDSIDPYIPLLKYDYKWIVKSTNKTIRSIFNTLCSQYN